AGELDEKMLRGLDYESVMCELMKVHGIGEKVANCIALFGLSKRNAFPVDVWIKRIMEELYIGHEADKKEIGRLAQGLFGEYGGYAQQYLFY
ncbi:MAG TPA: N-glycosylase, partial [Eubacterium sp.]|nr:N-glycosylase [Eubacterium sp.]